MSKKNLGWKPNWSKRGGKGGRWYKTIDGKVEYFGAGKSPDDLKSYRQAEKKYFQFMQEREATAPVEVALARATVTEISEKYLQSLFSRYERGEISAQYLEKCRCCLDDFCSKVGRQKKFGCIGEMDLNDYRDLTLSLPVSDKTGRAISPSTAKGRLATVRTMYNWAYKMHLIENKPRNLDGYANVALPEPRAELFTMDELKTLWDAASQRCRCWMLLALNAGFYQGDISDLTASEFSKKNQRITRRRSKTGVLGSFKLWPITVEYLLAEREPEAEGDDRLFLTHPKKKGAKPRPLTTQRVKDGVVKKTDAITCAFWSVQNKTGINSRRSFSSLRNTGASMIETIDPLVTEQYLSHAVNGMKKHYVQRDWGRLDAALDEMWGQLKGILKPEGRP